MDNSFIPHLLTYPRSGSHYFQDILYKEAQINFTKSHWVEDTLDKNNNKQRTLITIARDPKDSILSYLGLMNLKDRDHEFITSEKITEYILMYSFLLQHADYVIDFNDMIKYPELVIKKLLSLLNINENNYHLFNREIVPKYKNFIPSSKSLPIYKSNALDGVDIDLCYFYYNKLLERKIII